MKKSFLSFMLLLLAGLPVTKTKAVDRSTVALSCVGTLATLGGGIATYLSYQNKKYYKNELKKLRPVIKELLDLEIEEFEHGFLTEQKKTRKRKLYKMMQLLKQKEKRWLWATIGSGVITGLGAGLLGYTLVDYLRKRKSSESTGNGGDDEEEGGEEGEEEGGGEGEALGDDIEEEGEGENAVGDSRDGNRGDDYDSRHYRKGKVTRIQDGPGEDDVVTITEIIYDDLDDEREYPDAEIIDLTSDAGAGIEEEEEGEGGGGTREDEIEDETGGEERDKVLGRDEILEEMVEALGDLDGRGEEEEGEVSPTIPKPLPLHYLRLKELIKPMRFCSADEKARRLAKVRRLIEEGRIDVQSRTLGSYGRSTLLSHASDRREEDRLDDDMMKLFLNKGATLTESQRENPDLTYALLMKMARVCTTGEMKRFIIQCGIDTELKGTRNGAGCTPLLRALAEDAEIRHRRARTGGEAEKLLACGANVDAEGPGGKTPLVRALQECDMKTFKKFICYGADVNQGCKRDRFGENESLPMLVELVDQLGVVKDPGLIRWQSLDAKERGIRQRLLGLQALQALLESSKINIYAKANCPGRRLLNIGEDLDGKDAISVARAREDSEAVELFEDFERAREIERDSENERLSWLMSDAQPLGRVYANFVGGRLFLFRSLFQE